ncbi:ATP-binding cassette domain-containing protein [Streptobacillus felis]|uniref:ABC transporter ATP-binding protein n=1 Tax=Streptobacillus felis TaxID=1384509 RepID=A0A7Z0TBD4_9FUSO|nr:ATP-binding cassette domain-containing protein [Streptobacillus felis]NYV27248.1 ABC transporter ATP-binding protein [Streptobacillus felis]
MKIVEINNLIIKSLEKNIVDNISFYINSGEVLSLIGSSGSGKSQIAKTIKGISKLIINGEIKLNNIDKNEIGYIFQDFSLSLNPVLKIKNQLIEAVIYHKKMKRNLAIEKAKNIFKYLNLEESILEKYPFELSGGQKQRVVIAICLMMEPKLLICDEITTGLDNINEYEILKLITSLNISVLLITHNIYAVKKLSNRILLLNKGKILQVDNIEELKKYNDIEYINAMNRVFLNENY